MMEQNTQLLDQRARKMVSKMAPTPTITSIRAQKNERLWFTVCLLAPVGGALLRKLLPGQPTYAEVAAVIPVLLATVWTTRHGRTLPAWLSRPLIFWGLFQAVFAIPAVLDDWRVGAAILFTRITPMLMVVVAYDSIHTWSDFWNASKWVIGLAIILLPIGLVVVFFGNVALPRLLQPIDKVLLVERDIRNGFPAAATIFTTQWILSWSALAILYLALSNLLLPAGSFMKTKKERYAPFIGAVASLILIYASIRRGALIAGIVGFIAYFILLRRNLSARALIFAIIIVFGLSQLIDSYGYVVGNNFRSRSEQSLILEELDPTKRINDVFLPYFTFWLRTTPLGNYTGFAGPEVSSLGVTGFKQYSQIVEVGGAQLIAEMGILGAVVMPLGLLIISINILQKSRGMICAPAVKMLLLFQVAIFLNYYFKELLALVNPSMGVFFFWAVPGLCAALIEYESEKHIDIGSDYLV